MKQKTMSKFQEGFFSPSIFNEETFSGIQKKLLHIAHERMQLKAERCHLH